MNKKKFRINFRKEYRNSWNFIKKSKKYIYWIIGLFFAFAIIGFFFPVPEALESQILEAIRDILNQTEGKGFSGLSLFIFWNNFKASILGMLFGVLLGIYPIFSTVTNGYFLGFVASHSVREVGVLSLWRILPHGIFELSAVFISLGMGLRLGVDVIKLRGKKRELRKTIANAFKTFFLVAFPLLLIAAIIETALILFF